ncbi:hypothetical protein Adt_47438 [Abeliophyllum distichum]|uniref:Uncharacterized protein n=1 Tax=Abeliophyllum distichum TaxID=126358 RepID=A0ABD1NU38_9LAMI
MLQTELKELPSIDYALRRPYVVHEHSSKLTKSDSTKLETSVTMCIMNRRTPWHEVQCRFGSYFIDSENEYKDDDDLFHEQNITEGIEIEVEDRVLEGVRDIVNEVDDLEYSYFE